MFGKYLVIVGEGKQKRKRRKFGGQRRRGITEKETNENNWKREIYSLRRRRKTERAENFWRRNFLRTGVHFLLDVLLS